MYLGRLTLVAAIVLAAPAQASDAPRYAPAPDWVKPVAVPQVAASPSEAPVRVLLSDQQIAFDPGRQTSYIGFAMLIQTPQGLEAGNISFPWRPDTDDLVIHKFVIRRAGKTIDILAGGQKFTVVRREPNLDNAMLDGVLTANIQPEGLQVGDILEFAVSVISSDPVLKGHVETIAAGWDDGPIARAHLRMQWPSSLPIRLRQGGVLPALKTVKANGTTSVELSLDNIEPVPGPKGAPLRYHLGRRVEATDFAAWADIGTLLAPLYRTAARLPKDGPLADEVARIAASSADPKVRVQAALTLVQDRIRYVALAMGTGGLVPTDAATTWARRFGDCKAKTALLIAVLESLGIAAEPVAVSTQIGDGLDERLPMVGAFDHVLVRAIIAGRTYWLDGTRKGDTSLDRLRVPDVGWGLPLRSSGATLVPMMPTPLDQPTQSTAIRIDASAGVTVPAPVKVETIFRGDAAIAANAGLSNLAGDARERALKAYWKREYDFIEPTRVNATFDPVTGEQRVTLEGMAKMDWSSGWYETDGTAVGYRADFAREAGPNRDAPFRVNHPSYTRSEETIVLPPGFPDDTSRGNDDIDRTIAGMEYKRKSSLSNQLFQVVRTERSVAAEFAAKDAPAAEVALRELAKQTLYIRKPASYRVTDAELASAMKDTPTSIRAYNTRGSALMDRGRMDEAIKDFDGAIALDPKDATAYANRGIARGWQEKLDLAAADLDRALEIDPRNAVAFRGRALIAQQKGQHREAIDAFTKSLEFEQGNDFATARRALSYRAIGDDEAALNDATAVLSKQPGAIDLYGMRANIYRRRGQIDKMVAEAAAMVTANPDNAYAHVLAANLYASEKRDVEATRAFDRALAIRPEAYIYVNRANYRPKTDRAGRLADFDAALKLDPKSTDAMVGKARLMTDGGDPAGAIAIYTNAVAILPNDLNPLLQRGILKVKTGDIPGGERDFADARARAKTANDYNNMCWAKATAGVALVSAITDCDLALAKQPDEAAYLDSKAFVLLRLGRNDEAIGLYDRAVARSPTQAASLFGRAVAWARKGDKAKSAADRALALKQSPGVAETFADYGVVIDGP